MLFVWQVYITVMFKKHITSVDQIQTYATTITYPRTVSIFHGHYPEKHTLHNLILEIDNQLKNTKEEYTTNIYGDKTDFNSFNDNKDFLHFIKYVQKQIIMHPNGSVFHAFWDRYELESWAVKIKKQDYIRYHNHPCWHCILYLSDGVDLHLPELNISITPKIGDWYVLPSNILHGAEKSNNEKCRYSLICNFRDKGDWKRLNEIKVY